MFMPGIVFKFYFRDFSLIPVSIPALPDETLEEAIKRWSAQPKGVRIMDYVEDVEASPCCKSLVSEDSPYEIVSAFSQKRLRGKGRRSAVLRFDFCRPDLARASPQVKEKRYLWRGILQDMASEALWRVNGYLNPEYFDGQKNCPGQSLNLNFSERVARFGAKRRPLRRRIEDESGARYMDVEPAHVLYFDRKETKPGFRFHKL